MTTDDEASIRHSRGTASRDRLLQSSDMDPVAGTIDIRVPLDDLWELFTRADLWPRWNRCFFWAFNRELTTGKLLVWCFEPIRWWYLYKMFAIAKIIDVEPRSHVTWEVSVLPGFYAHHTYHMEDLGDGRTRFGSWEKATGWSFRLMRRFWLAHFTFVKDRSLEGGRTLERIYASEASLTEETLPRRRSWLTWVVVVVCATVVAAGSWLYRAYLHQTVVELAPQVYAVLAGGGNSLVVQSDGETLVVDSKFPPGSHTLRRWVASIGGGPVTTVVNTHYHYDHTQGNALYPGARIIAHQRVPELMIERDPLLWKDVDEGKPTELISDSLTVRVGRRRVVLTHPGPAHTHGDLVVYLPDDNIVATGDIHFHTYYPFIDVGPGGTAMPELAQVLFELAEGYPDAVFLPGHGPLATADDVRSYARYLFALYQAVDRALSDGMTEEQAVAAIALSEWAHLSILPASVFQKNALVLTTADNNTRWMYQLLGASRR